MLSPFFETRFPLYFSPSERLIVQALEDDPFADIDRCLRYVRKPTLHLMKKLNHERKGMKEEFGKVVSSKKDFAIELDVSQFRPEELSVSVRKNEVVVEGRHEERDEDGSKVERHFVRRYTIPDSVNGETVESHMSQDGVLTIKGKKLELESSSRSIPIQCAGGQKRPIEEAAEDDKPTKRSRKGKK